jgi:hypothetical protein
MQKSVELSKILEDVSYIISSKLRDALTPVIETQNSTESVILNLPFVQNIVSENRTLKFKNAELETKLAILREKYKQLFLKQVSEITVPAISKSHLKNENNINLEIEEFNINRKDYPDSNIEQEIIRLNKDELLSNDDSNSDSESSENDEHTLQNELNFYLTNNPVLCNKAINNYKRYYNLNNVPSIETVFNSTAGIRGWGEASLNVEEKKIEVIKIQDNTTVDEDDEEEEEVEEEEKEQVIEEEEEKEEVIEEEEEEEVVDEDDEDDEEEEDEEVEEEEEEEVVEEEDEEVEEVVEEEVEEEVEEVVEEVVEEEVVEEEDEEEEELEVEEIMIKGKMFYTDSSIFGDIYRAGEDGDIEEVVGKFQKSVAIFY